MKMKEGMSHEEVLKQMKIAAMTLDTGPAEQYDLQMAFVEILILQVFLKTLFELSVCNLIISH